MNTLHFSLVDDYATEHDFENTEAHDIIHEIETNIRETFNNEERGSFILRFTTIGGIILQGISIPNTGLAEQITSKINVTLLEKLEKSLTFSEIGSWLHCEIHYHHQKEQFVFKVNRTKRFNVNNKNWVYDIDDDVFKPTREEFLYHFKKHARAPYFMPEWHDSLVKEQQKITELIKNSTVTEVFNEAFNTKVFVPEEYLELEKNDSFISMWNELDETYKEVLSTQHDLLKFFIDEDKFTQQSYMINVVFQKELLETFLEKTVPYSNAEDRAKILNLFFSVIGNNNRYPIYDESGFQQEEIDLESLDEDYSSMVNEFITIQTKQRFPDLDSQ